MIKTKIHYYRFDISKTEDKNKYLKLSEDLKSKGLELFDSISLSDYETKTNWFNKIKELEKKGVVELDTKYIFNNQWNTTNKSFNLRVFEWAEEIYPNKDIKEGYYLELNKDMKEIKENTFKCGFCGKQYLKKDIEKENKVFCDSCLDSEYLKEEDFILLRLKSVMDNTPYQELTEKEKGLLLKNYEIKQKIRHKKYFENKLKEIEEEKNNEVKNINIEYEGKKWLLNHKIPLDNVIYYNHSKMWCFGWDKKLSFQDEQDLKEVLERNNEDKFPFPFKIKV